jgi:hypothetical protein
MLQDASEIVFSFTAADVFTTPRLMEVDKGVRYKKGIYSF